MKNLVEQANNWLQSEACRSGNIVERTNTVVSAFRSYILEEKKEVCENTGLSLSSITDKIDAKRVYHIHGVIDDKDSMVVGHGLGEEELNDMLKSQELRIGEVWNKKLNRMTRLQIVTPKHKELAALSSLESIVSLKKDVEGCIEKNQQFFNEIFDIERIYVFGFSFSSIDMPYLEKIIRRTKPETHWVISWYSQEDKRRIMDFVIRYDIQNITIIKKIKHIGIQK